MKQAQKQPDEPKRTYKIEHRQRNGVERDLLDQLIDGQARIMADWLGNNLEPWGRSFLIKNTIPYGAAKKLARAYQGHRTYSALASLIDLVENPDWLADNENPRPFPLTHPFGYLYGYGLAAHFQPHVTYLGEQPTFLSALGEASPLTEDNNAQAVVRITCQKEIQPNNTMLIVYGLLHNEPVLLPKRISPSLAHKLVKSLLKSKMKDDPVFYNLPNKLRSAYIRNTPVGVRIVFGAGLRTADADICGAEELEAMLQIRRQEAREIDSLQPVDQYPTFVPELLPIEESALIRPRNLRWQKPIPKSTPADPNSLTLSGSDEDNLYEHCPEQAKAIMEYCEQYPAPTRQELLTAFGPLDINTLFCQGTCEVLDRHTAPATKSLHLPPEVIQNITESIYPAEEIIEFIKTCPTLEELQAKYHSDEYDYETGEPLHYPWDEILGPNIIAQLRG